MVLAGLCHQIISNSVENQQNKQDSAEVNHIKYGLFSLNKWKEQLSGIIADEINHLNLIHANELQLKKHVEAQLGGLIDQVDKKIREKNKGSAKGWVKQSFIDAFVDIKDIKDGIPEYADAIIAELSKAQTERQLKSIVKKRIDDYLDKTFEVQDTSKLDHILQETKTPDIESARSKLSQEIAERQRVLFLETGLLISLSMILFIMAGLGRKALSGPQYVVLLMTLVLLLLAGVTTPMIDMEVKISELRLMLMGHPVSFVNQVLYFQTKSVLDVFWIMITNEALQMKVVGLLMITFSIIFPLSKMLSSLFYYYNFRTARTSRWVHFFVFKSGKWSMADVLVVVIFMAYIGFNGIITSQFGHLNTADQEVVILTTNGTSLQPGFYIFLTYAMLAMFLPGLLTKGSQPSPA